MCPQPEPDEIYAAYLADVLGGKPGDFEALCHEHPEQADDLRELHDGYEHVHRALNRMRQVESTISEGSEESRSSVKDTRTSVESQRTRYELKGEVARGGMGAVLRAFDCELRRDVAMKVILDATERADLTNDAQSRALLRFLDEAQITGQLEHPGVVPVHELGVDSDGGVYFTMRLVKGTTLRDVFQQHADDPHSVGRTHILGILLKACEAMAYAHSKGVVHRDLKPSNVMVGRFGEVYIMDWGLAKVMGKPDAHDLRIAPEVAPPTRSIHTKRRDMESDDNDSPVITMDGTVVGTPAYMSIEQARGEVDQIGPRSDVYAMGALLYELLTGQVPYVPKGTAMSPRTVLAALNSGPPTPIHKLVSDVPMELAAICEKAMSRNVEERYENTMELADDLRAYLEHRVVRAYRTGALAEFSKWIQRNRSVATGLLAALLLAAVGLTTGFVVQQSSRNQVAQALTEVERFSDVLSLRRLEEEADQLWPRRPALQRDYERWLDAARAMVDRLPLHEDSLRRSQDRAAALGALSTDPAEQATWSEAQLKQRWRCDTAAEMVTRLQELSTRIVEVEGRVEVAHQIAAQTLDDAEEAWEDAIFEISEHFLYDGLEIEPQVGLIPLGPDPDSGLWEFWHVESGERPEREGDTGPWQVGFETGIVLVLIPGGVATLGWQDEDPSAPNHDPFGFSWERVPGVREETLEPFFISKYELTQGQWLYLTGENPSQWGPVIMEKDVRHHPVENVNWYRCRDVLHRYGLALPTEDQWEYAARGGTDTPWYIGREKIELSDHANLADVSYAELVRLVWTAERWRDGHDLLAPVGQFPPNAFGLHDAMGNVWEWCVPYVDDDTVKDPEFRGAIRGGSYRHTGLYARTGRTDSYRAIENHQDVGVRPVYPLRR